MYMFHVFLRHPVECLWPGDVMVRALDYWTCDSEGRGPTPGVALSGNNLGQVVHTYVPLSPNGVI